MSEVIAVDVAIDFIAVVAEETEKLLRTNDTVTVLFPNRRTVRFFENRLTSPLLLKVSAAALEDFTKEAVYSHSPSPPFFQRDIDRFFLLYDLIKNHPSLYQRLGGSLELVFPWCRHLSLLFDEFDRHLFDEVTPLPYAENVVKEAEAILRRLDILYKDYRLVMEKENLTYHGDISRRLVALKEHLTGPFLLAGFTLLTKAQRSLFLHLFRNHTTIVLFHTDLEKRHPVLDPYRIYDTWMNGAFWGKRPKERRKPPKEPQRTISFYESFDSHAEIRQAAHVMSQTRNSLNPAASPLEVGIILPEGSSLLPLLYALDNLELPMNVTLGFPATKSNFYTLIESLIELTITRHERWGFHHRSLDKFLSHPYTHFLRVDGVPFGETAQKLRDEIISQNLSFLRFNAFTSFETLTDKDLHLCHQLEEEFLSPFINARTLHDMGQALVHLIHGFKNTLLRDDRFSLERQTIQDFLDRILPNLILSRSATRDLSSPKILCQILRHLISSLRIPFEGNPLEGIQVMGMLESRLLSFRNLFILDVNEGILPKNIKIDPLFPPSLHPLLGLPSIKTRESLFRYNFFRLVDASRHIHLFYQQGTSGEDKKVRSRFVEQLVLEEELHLTKKDGSLSSQDVPQSPLVKTYTFQVPLPTRPKGNRPSFYPRKLQECLAKGISPSLLDDYLTCPHLFYLKRIVGIPEAPEIQEIASSVAIGNMIHHILETAFRNLQNIPLSPHLLKRAKKTAMETILPSIIRYFPTLTPLRTNLLRRLMEHRLHNFFTYQEEIIHTYDHIQIKATEKKLATHFETYRLYGKVDRIDFVKRKDDRPPLWRIIDYKTGSFTRPPSSKLAEFLQNFDSSDYSLTALSKLHSLLPSTQLPIYLYLFRKNFTLKEGDEVETTLLYLGIPFGKRLKESVMADSLPQSHITSLIDYLINHMRHTPHLAPYETAYCPFCPYITICPHTPRAKRSQM